MSWRRRKTGHWIETIVPKPRPLLWLGLWTVSSVAVTCGVLAFWVDFSKREGNLVKEILYYLRPFRFFILGLFFLIAVYCWRRRGMALRIHAPGPISVPPLKDETEGSSLSIDRLTTYLREKLNQVNIQAPAPIPGGSQQIEFAEVLRTPTVDAGNVGATLAVNIGRLLAAGHVSYAYQVDGALFNSRDGKCGVTLQVMVLPKWASPPITCTDETWELAIEQAAYEVCAFILPLTKLVDKPPWPAWRRLAIPAQLFRDVQLAQECKMTRRFDEALRNYYEALKLDPHNPYLRLEVGMLQEQIGLYMDALVTYEDVIDLAPSCMDLKVFHFTRRKPVYFRRRGAFFQRDWWRIPLLMARYRQAILLGMGERLSDEWSRAEIGGLRAKECVKLRSRIKEIFGEESHAIRHRRGDRYWRGQYFEGFQQYLIDQEGEPGVDGKMRSGQILPIQFDEILPDGSPLGTSRERLIQREFFQFVGQVRAQQLSRAYFFPRIIPGRQIPRAALRLLLIWNPVRRCWTRSLRLVGKSSEFRGISYLSAYRVVKRPAIAKNYWAVVRRLSIRHGKAGMSWPVKEHDVSRRLLLSRHGMRLSHLSPHWQEFYDIACVYATCMLPSEGGVAKADGQPAISHFSLPLERTDGRATQRMVARLADKAVDYLEKSSRLQDSGFASSIRPWVLADDPDLVGLRKRPEFTRWADRHFPTKNPNRVRPDNVHEIESIYYEQLLIKQSAALAAAVWKHRSAQALNGGLRKENFREWLKKEESWWDLTAEFVANRRHWQTRYKAIRAMRELGQDTSPSDTMREFSVPYPAYSEDPVIQLPAANELEFKEKVGRAQERRNGRIRDLADILEGRQEWCLCDVSNPSSPYEISRFCRQLAARWGTLAKAFHEQINDGELETHVSVRDVGKKPDTFPTADAMR